MILGRNTQQWLGLISAAAATLQVLIVTLVPAVDAAAVAVVIGAISGFLGVVIAFIANTYTTPTYDPQLKAGTMVRVTDDEGNVVAHAPVPTPPAARPKRGG